MGLLALIREYGDEIESDLAFRGIDLLDLWRGKLSPRKLDVLIRGLPAESATRMAMNDRQPLWTRTDHILADLVDSVALNTWVLANKDVEPSKRQKQPTPYERPGMAKPKRVVTAEKLRDFQRRTRGN